MAFNKKAYHEGKLQKGFEEYGFLDTPNNTRLYKFLREHEKATLEYEEGHQGDLWYLVGVLNHLNGIEMGRFDWAPAHYQNRG